MKLKTRLKKICSFTLVFTMIASAFTGVGTTTTKAAQATYFKAYEKAAYETISSDFSLKVDGKNVDVVSYYQERYSYAHIAYEGTTTFEIKALHGNIESYNISPHSYNIEPQIDGNTMKFELEQKKSRYLVIDITAGGKKDQIVIAADPNLNLKAPEVDGNKVVSITDYGVVAGDKGDGSENSKKIQNAINDVSSRGGGTVVVPKGWYKFVTIDSKDNVTLYLDEGAVLRGSGDRTEYSWNGPGGNGRQVKRRDIKITSKNFSIIGEGMVDANAVVLALPRENNRTSVPSTPQGDYYPTGWDDFRKGIVDADGANGITFTGVTFKDATGWTFNITKSKNIDMDNVKMLDDYAVVHSDGYDIVACQDVEIMNCLGLCGDDVFCPKGSDSSREMKNYLYKDCVAYARGGAGCKVGVQASSKSYNIEFNNIDVIQGYRGFSISRDEGAADWNDIRFIDIRTEKVFVESNPTDNGQYRPAPIVIWAVQKNNVTGNVSDIEVTNCSIEDTSGIKAVMKGETVGSTGEKGVVSDVTFKNFVMEGRTITQDNWQRYFEVSGNVEKDTIKFNNTELLTPAISKYEGETASKSGANYGKSEACSGRFKAGSIGKSGDKNNTVTFAVYEEEAGEHEINVYACTKGERSFEITVNGEDTQELVCDGDSFDIPVRYTIKANLKQGENKIVFGNSKGAAPDLDKIEVIEYEPEKALSLEAETGALTGAEPLVVPSASNGYCVEKLGGTDKGTATFKVKVEEDGEREVKVYYAAEKQSELNLVVNGTTYKLDCPSTGSLTTMSKTPAAVTVKLDKGENTIQLEGAEETNAPIVDRLLVEMTDEEAQAAVQTMIDALPEEAKVTLEDEMQVNAVKASYNALYTKSNVDKTKLTAAVAAIEDVKMLTVEVEAGVLAPEETLSVNESDKCSNGYFIGDMGQEKGGTATFKLYAEEAGTRKLNIYYITELDRKLSVKVNDDAAQTVICDNLDKADWKTPESEPASVEIELKKGENTLVLSSISDEKAYAPNLDKLEIELTPTEAAKTVEGLISNLPEELDEENKLYFTAVRTSYDDLSNKKAVTNGAVLREALGLPEEPDEEPETPEEDNNPPKDEDVYTPGEDPDESKDEKPGDEDPDGTKDEKPGDETPGTSDDQQTNPSEEDDAYTPKEDPDVSGGDETGELGDEKDEPDPEKQEVVVTFDSAGGTPVAEQTWYKGEHAEKPEEDPEKTGYIFLGWYVGEEEYDFDTPLEESIELTAKWKEQEVSDDTNPPVQKEDTTGGQQTQSNVTPDATNGNQNTNEVKVQEIRLTGVSQKIAVGSKIALNAEIIPANATNKALVWSSSNTDYATVNGNGLVTTKKAGANKKVTITATAADGSGIVAEYKIQLMQKAVKKIKLSVGNKTVKAGEKITVKAVVTPKASSKRINNKLNWMSSNPNYATVTSKGVVKTQKSAKGKSVRITAIATDGTNRKASIKIKIK